MVKKSREALLNIAFVSVADTLTDDYDIVDLLHSLVEDCTNILDTQAGGLMLADTNGDLQLMASTSERANLVELMQLAAGSGPCVDCFTTGLPVAIADIAATGDRWPAFRDAAAQQGFLAVHATPMKLRGEVIGTMNLFQTSRGLLTDEDAAVAQALADVATIGILQERLNTRTQVVAEQLARALDSRILVEQAKGVLAESERLSMDDAFNTLRLYARTNGLSLRDVAEGVVNRTLRLTSPTPARAVPRPPRRP